MKKTLLVLLLIVALVMPLAAAPKLNIKQASKGALCVGVNLGTNLGVALKWDNRNWDLYANVGYGVVGAVGIQAELGAELPVSEFKVGNETMKVNAGIMAPLYIGVSSSAAYFGVGALATAAVSYEFRDFPLEVYTRLGLGVGMTITPAFGVGFGYSGALGAVYKLN